MDDAWLDRLGRRVGASRAELVGLAILLSSGIAMVAMLLWWHPSGERAVPDGASLSDGEPTTPDGGLEAATVVVHVSGAVAAPGVVALPMGARVHDAIAAAGGALPTAQLAGLNLARVLVDGEQVHLGAMGEEPEVAASGVRGDGRIDINRASAAELDELPGIGPTLAERIVRWRTDHGPFTSTGQLRDVSGIGERVFQALADLVVV